MKSIYEQMGGTYKQCGDYLIPDLTILEEKFTIWKYGRARERYLKEYRRCHYSYLLSTGNLSEHLHEVDVQARKILKQFISAAEKSAPDKATHQMEWVGHFNNVKASAEEVINHELIYV